MVRYEGRGESTLGPGERLVIIKRDRSILVHRPEGYEPVNWQPPNSHIDVDESEEGLVLTVTRKSEKLVITFPDPPEIYIFHLIDEAEFEMYATEMEMKRAVILEPKLIEEGFKPLEDERQVFQTGRIDVLGRDSEGRLVVVELKKRRASQDDIMQLMRYTTSLEREMGERPRAIIAAPSISRTASKLCGRTGVEFKCLTPRSCTEVLRKRSGLRQYLS